MITLILLFGIKYAITMLLIILLSTITYWCLTAPFKPGNAFACTLLSILLTAWVYFSKGTLLLEKNEDICIIMTMMVMATPYVIVGLKNLYSNKLFISQRR